MSEILDNLAVSYLDNYRRTSAMGVGHIICPKVFDKPPAPKDLSVGIERARQGANVLNRDFDQFMDETDAETIDWYQQVQNRRVADGVYHYPILGRSIQLVPLPTKDSQKRTHLAAVPIYDSTNFGFMLCSTGGSNKPAWLARAGDNSLRVDYERSIGTGRWPQYPREYNHQLKLTIQELQKQAVVRKFLTEVRRVATA